MMLNDNAKTANNVCRCSGMDLKHCAKSWQPGLLFAFTAFCPLLHSVEDFFHGLPCCLGWHAWRPAGLFFPDKLICLCKCGGSFFGCHGFHPCQCDVRFFAEPLHQKGVWTSTTFAEQLTCAQTGHTCCLCCNAFTLHRWLKVARSLVKWTRPSESASSAFCNAAKQAAVSVAASTALKAVCVSLSTVDVA